MSCPTLRPEPYRGAAVDAQLDDQMRRLLAGGAAVLDREDRLISLSRIFLWYGSDFVRPHRMPSLLPVARSRILGALRPWLQPEEAKWVEVNRPRVEFQDYDWGLACTVG